MFRIRLQDAPRSLKTSRQSVFCWMQCVEEHIPGLANVDDIDAVWASLPQVWLHVDLEVLCANVALGGQEHLNVLSSGVERRWKVLSGHLRGGWVVKERRWSKRCRSCCCCCGGGVSKSKRISECMHGTCRRGSVLRAWRLSSDRLQCWTTEQKEVITKMPPRIPVWQCLRTQSSMCKSSINFGLHF